MTAAVLGKDYEYCVRPDINQQVSEPTKYTKWQLQDAAERLLPNERIKGCGKTLVHGAEGVIFYNRPKTGGIYLKNTMVCGSVWHCPVCAAKVSEHRREDLQAAIDQAKMMGHDIMLLTLTIPHTMKDRLDELLPAHKEALRRLKSGRAFQKIKEKYGIIGSIRALEVTHGENGWHPHTHELLFIEKKLSMDAHAEMSSDIYDLWRTAAVRAGLGEPSPEHGLDLRAGNKAAEYVGKWGFACELTKLHLKQGKRKGRTPWDLLKSYCDGDKHAGFLFREFAQCFKGKNQLFWSRGLRDYLNYQDELFTDEELADCMPKDAVPSLFINMPVWYQVIKRGLRHKVYHLAEHDRDVLIAMLEGIAIDCRYPLGWGRVYEKYH